MKAKVQKDQKWVLRAGWDGATASYNPQEGILTIKDLHCMVLLDKSETRKLFVRLKGLYKD